MEKQTFYVSVQSGNILADKGDSPYEFEIEANEEEIKQLQSLFARRNEADWGTFLRAHVPIVPYSYDSSNDQYDQNLYEIYNKIYELGSQQTKYQIESLGILQ